MIRPQLLLAFFVIGSISCKKENAGDPCSETTCLNGGTCVDGTCNCPIGYTGADCGAQVTPSLIRVHSITITSFLAEPFEPWDVGSDPDLYAELTYGSNAQFWQSPDTIHDAAPFHEYTFAVEPPLELMDTDGQYTLVLWDIDDSDRMWMGAVSFRFYDSLNDPHGGFPEVVTIESPGQLITGRADITYEW